MRFLSNKRLFTSKPSRRRVPYTAVIKLAKMLMMSIVANPFTELVPYTNKTTPAMIVVMFASKIVPKEPRFPMRYADISDFPSFNSSFIRSYVIIFASTAIPTPRMSAAIPGSVSTPFIQSKTSKIR